MSMFTVVDAVVLLSRKDVAELVPLVKAVQSEAALVSGASPVTADLVVAVTLLSLGGSRTDLFRGETCK